MKINMNQLSKLVKEQPKFTTLFIGLSQIDNFIKEVVKDTIENQTSNPDNYYVKTELDGGFYVLTLFNAEQRRETETRWQIDIFLEHCKNKTVEFQIQTAVCRMIKKFDKKEG